MFPASQVNARGVKGSYVSQEGGFGLGYQIDGQIVKSGGNGFYYPVAVESFQADGGAGYMTAVRFLFTGKR